MISLLFCPASTLLKCPLTNFLARRPCSSSRSEKFFFSQLLQPKAKASNVNALEAAAGRGHGETIRLNKAFKATHSRREADRLIENGRVLVNGKIPLPGDRVGVGDKVTLDGKTVKFEEFNAEISASPKDSFAYIKYWKPTGVTCTTDERIEGNIIDTLKRSGLFDHV